MTTLQQRLPAYQNKRVTVVDKQATADIINYIAKVHEMTKADYNKISKDFWKGNVKDTAKGLFDFLKQNVTYKIESGEKQTVKTPSAILHEKQGDCKHYASFIVGVVDSLNRKGYPIEAGYMYVNSLNSSDNFHHVFGVVVDPKTGKDYWTDPIYRVFDRRKEYLNEKFVPMALQIVSGDVEMGKKQKVSKSQKKANRQANKQARKENANARKAERAKVRAMPKAERKQYKKAKRQDKREDRKAVKKNATGAQKVSHIALKVPNAISRGSFLTLLKMNAFRMASKIADKAAKDPQWRKDMQGQWHGAGGEWRPLVQAVNQGVNVWNKGSAVKVAQISGMLAPDGSMIPLQYPQLFRPVQEWEKPFCNCETMQEVENNADAMGADPYTWASIAAVVAAAMPLILKLTGLLKRADVNTDELNEAGFESTEEVLDDYNDRQEFPIDEDDMGNYGNSNTPQYGIRGYNDPNDGNATVEYTKSNVNENGDIDYSPDNLNLNQITDNVKNWVVENKNTLFLVGGGLLAVKFLPDIIKSFSGKKKRR